MAAEDLGHAVKGLEEGGGQDDDDEDLDPAARVDRPQDKIAEQTVAKDENELGDRGARAERQRQPVRRRGDPVADEPGIDGVGSRRQDLDEFGRQGDDLEDGKSREDAEKDLDETGQTGGAAMLAFRSGFLLQSVFRTSSPLRFAMREGSAADVKDEKGDGRRFEDEDRPFFDRADGQRHEDEDRAQSPEDNVIDQFIPLAVSYEKPGGKTKPEGTRSSQMPIFPWRCEVLVPSHKTPTPNRFCVFGGKNSD